MRNFSTLFAALALGVCGASAQTRYLDPLFQVDVSADSSYGVNFTYLDIFLGLQGASPRLDTLTFRAYTPQGDTATNRPVFIISHTGSYLPPLINGGLTGSYNDRAVIEFASKLAARGYVVVTPNNRLGWAATSQDIDVQTSTLLLASYRGAQDMHTMARYLRKTVAEDDNPYGIDSNRIAVFGLGTGGYNALNGNFVDNVEEVNRLDKLINNQTNEPYLNPDVQGDPYGEVAAGTNNPNWVGYTNGFQFVAQAGGALGDSSWIDGNPIEAPVTSFHYTDDRNAPFGIENITVPTTGNTVLQQGAGGRVVVEVANAIGLNAPFDNLNDSLLAADEELTLRVAELSDDAFTTPKGGFETTLATPNFYPFVVPADSRQANLYNWVDSAVLGPIARQRFAAGQLPRSWQQLVDAELVSNASIFDSATAARHQDTILRFMLPRAYVALGLGTDVQVSVDLAPAEVDLAISPNPARDAAVVQVRRDVELTSVRLVNVSGQTVLTQRASGSRVELDLAGLRPGLHYVLLQTDLGSVAQTLVVE